MILGYESKLLIGQNDDPFLKESQGGDPTFFLPGPPPPYIFFAVLKIAWGLGKRCGTLEKIHPLPP